MKILLGLLIFSSFTVHSQVSLKIIVPKGVSVSTSGGIFGNAVFDEDGKQVKVGTLPAGWEKVPKEQITEAFNKGNCYPMTGSYHYRVEAISGPCPSEISRCRIEDSTCYPKLIHHQRVVMPSPNTNQSFKPMDQSQLFRHIHGLD